VRRLLALVGAIVFVDTMFFAALTPLLPEYADRFELSKVGAGILQGAYPAGALLGGIPSGIATSRFGARTTAVAGLVVMAGSTLTFGLADSILVLDVSRFVQGFASASAWTAGLAWLVTAAPPNRRGQLIGAAMGMAIVGALFGPVLGALGSWLGTEAVFGTVAVLELGLACWALATPALPPQAPQPLRDLGTALRDRRILAGVWFVTLPALLFGTLGVLAPLRLNELGMGALGISVAYIVSASFEAAISPLLGWVSDRRGRLLPLRWGLIGSAIVTALLPWPDRKYVLAALVVACGIAFGSFWTPAMSHLADLAETRGLDHGYTFAVVNIAWAPGQTLGSSGGGALADLTSDAVPYLTLSGLCLLTLATLWRSARSS
jgi:MFS family permease